MKIIHKLWNITDRKNLAFREKKWMVPNMLLDWVCVWTAWKKKSYTTQSPLKEFWITVLNTNVDGVFSLVLLSGGNRDSSLMLSALVTIWLFFYFSNLDNAHREQARRELIWDDVRSPDCCQLWTGGVQRSLYKRITEAFVCIWQTAQSLL